MSVTRSASLSTKLVIATFAAPLTRHEQKPVIAMFVTRSASQSQRQNVSMFAVANGKRFVNAFLVAAKLA